MSDTETTYAPMSRSNQRQSPPRSEEPGRKGEKTDAPATPLPPSPQSPPSPPAMQPFVDGDEDEDEDESGAVATATAGPPKRSCVTTSATLAGGKLMSSSPPCPVRRVCPTTPL